MTLKPGNTSCLLWFAIGFLSVSCGKDTSGPNGGRGETQGVTFVTIPGGTFQMGDVENTGRVIELPMHTVTLSRFEMSACEITNAQYCAYLKMAKASGDITVMDGDVYGASGLWSGQVYLETGLSFDAANKSWISYGNESFSVKEGYEQWPVVAVTWYGAKAFAHYYGYDLPTESEWEYACRGGRQYTFGTGDGSIDDGNANFYPDGPGHPIAVGSYPANPFHLYDMSGNVWEWCHDWYDTYPETNLTNPAGPQSGDVRVTRGGSWSLTGDFCRSAFRSGETPEDRYDVLGFRVVRRPGGLTY